MRSSAILALLILSTPALAQRPAAAPARTIEERTATMRKLDGYFPLYWDSAGGQLFMEIPPDSAPTTSGSIAEGCRARAS
jgi:hypothetical protein